MLPPAVRRVPVMMALAWLLAASPSLADDAVEEVVVGGRKEPTTPTAYTLKREEIRVVPGAFGDPFRALDTSPSVVPIVSGLPYFYVRGAPPSAVGYFVDEVRVPYLYHFAFGPGVIQPALIDDVTLHPAAFPGRYGGFAGGIVAGTTRDPAPELYGEGEIRLFDAGGYVEAPFADGKGSVGIGGRYAYPGAILSLVQHDLTIDYRDYNARISYALGDHWRASAFAFGSYDYAAQVEDGVKQVLFASEFHRLDLRLDRHDADGSTTRIAATVGLDRTRLGGTRFAENFITGVRARHSKRVLRDVEVEIGVNALLENFTGDLPSPYAVSRSDYAQAVSLFASHADSTSGAWLSTTYRPAEGWDLTAAMRADVYTSLAHAAVGPSPRASMRVPVTPQLAFLGALGVVTQPPAFALPVPAVNYRGLPGGLSYGYQKSAGLEVKLPWRFTLKTIGFHHSYVNVRDFAQDRAGLGFDVPQLAPGAPAQAFGVETSLARKLSEHFSAFATLNVNRAQLGSTRLLSSRVSPFDRTYVAQVGGVADLGRNWRASSRVLTYAGWPTDAPDAVKPTGGRLPPFYRLDVRLEKRWLWAEHRYLGLVFEGMNVTASTDVVSRTCAAGVCKNQTFGPVTIPSIGLEGAL